MSSAITSLQSYIIAGGIVGGLFCHCAYALGTVERKIIRIQKKYQFDKNGFTKFMIIDHTGKHYNVNNSFWYWKWNSIEDWHKLETNKDNLDIVIKYYGWRSPLFGMFPKIIRINEQDKLLDSITTTIYIPT